MKTPLKHQKNVGMEGVITQEPMVKKIQNDNDIFRIKIADKDVKVQRQFINFLEPADDQELEIQLKEGANSASSTACPADALTESNDGFENKAKEEDEHG